MRTFDNISWRPWLIFFLSRIYILGAKFLSTVEGPYDAPQWFLRIFYVACFLRPGREADGGRAEQTWAGATTWGCPPTNTIRPHWITLHFMHNSPPPLHAELAFPSFVFPAAREARLLNQVVKSEFILQLIPTSNNVLFLSLWNLCALRIKLQEDIIYTWECPRAYRGFIFGGRSPLRHATPARRVNFFLTFEPL